MNNNNPWSKQIENLTSKKKESSSNNSSIKPPVKFNPANVAESFNPELSRYSLNKKNNK